MIRIFAILLALLVYPGAAGAETFFEQIRDASKKMFNSVFSQEPDWRVHKDVPYGPDPAEKADLYLLNNGGNRPVILFIHGGAWVAGDKSGYAEYYAKKYAFAGFNVVAINYRLADKSDPETQWPAQLQDVQLAVRWLRHYRKNLGIDPNRICAFGDSAGGHLALLLGSLKQSRPGDRSSSFPAESPSVACVVNMFGPGDMTSPEFLKQIDGTALFGGRKYAEAPGLYADASPIRFIAGDSAPTLIVHGKKDVVVPFSSAQALLNTFNQNRVGAKLIQFEGGHWFQGLPSSKKAAIDEKTLEIVTGMLRP